MITRTPRTLIRGALRLIGVGGEDEDLSAATLNDAFEMMNEWMVSQGHSFQYGIVTESFDLTAGDYDYSIGSGGDFDTARPNQVLGGFIRQGGQDYHLTVMSRKEWDDKALNSYGSNPYKMYYRPSYPLGMIYLDSVIGTTIHLDLEKAISEVATLDTTMSMPQEYFRAIRFNMALELAPEYEKEPTQLVVKGAVESLDVIKTRNIANDIVTLDIDNIAKGYRDNADNAGAFTVSGLASVIVLDADGNPVTVST